MRLARPISAQLKSLCDWAELPAHSRQLLETGFTLLTQESLQQSTGTQYPGLSLINANGLPFQWSLCLGESLPSVRFLCEVGRPGSSPQDRFQVSIQKLQQLCQLADIPHPDWLHEVVIPHLVPEPSVWPSHWRSAIWFACGSNARGFLIKPYFNLNQGSAEERWRKIGWIFRYLGRQQDLARWCDLSGRVSNGSWPMGLAVDLLPNGTCGRIKVYFANDNVELNWLENWYACLHAKEELPRVRKILDVFPQARPGQFPARAFLVGVEFHDNKTAPTLKTDFALTRWIESDAEIVAGIRHLGEAFGISTCPHRNALHKLAAWPPSDTDCKVHRFLGYGYEPDGSHHLNVYLEPQIADSQSQKQCYLQTSYPRPVSVDHALRKAVQYLHRKQWTDGHWEDFTLPVGASQSWVTAYALWQMSYLPSALKTPAILESMQRGLRWLELHRTPGGGWGYHTELDDDADSTSLAILGMRRFGREIPQEALAFLKNCQRPDGGFATYAPTAAVTAAWGLSTPDVTPFALLALGKRLSARNRQKGRQYMEKNRNSRELWDSYWWVTSLYPTWGGLLLGLFPECKHRRFYLETVGKAYQALGVFDQALQLLCLNELQVTGPRFRLQRQLLEKQEPDGSWPVRPILRLSDPQISRPTQRVVSGQLHADTQSIFTTATAIRALCGAS